MSLRITDAKKALVNKYTDPDMGYTTEYPNAEILVPSSGVWVSLHHVGVTLDHFASDRDRVSGILQLSVMGNPDAGTMAILEVIDVLKERFKIGLKWTYSGSKYIVNGFSFTPVRINAQTKPMSVITVYWEGIG